MNDFDDWLNSLDLGTPASAETTARADTPQEAALSDDRMYIHMPDDMVEVPIIREESPVESVAVTQQPVTEPENLSAQDFVDLLTDIGINSPSEEAQAEEIHDGSDDEGVEEEELMEFNPESVANASFGVNIGTEGADLDAEEDAEWNNRIASGEIREVPAPSESSESSGPLLPENSPTLTINDATSRFSGTEWYKEIQRKRVTLAGLGGIGSWTGLLLGRMALETLEIFDDDKVETTNMSGQLYARNRIGKYKVDAMKELLGDYTSTISTFAIRRKFTEDENPSDIMICGFDNMAARKVFFTSWMNHLGHMNEEQKKQCLFIDGRLSIDMLQVFCIQGTDVEAQKRYEEEYLFSDEEADETVCSMKQTSYLAAMIGSVITNLFTNWVADSLDPVIPYDLPFYTEYNAQHMIFKTEH